MKVKVDTFLKGENLGGATSKSPVEATINSVKLIPAKELPYASDEDALQLNVTVNGEEFDWTPNKTSLRAIIKLYDDESDAWIGEKISLYSIEQSAFGKVQQIIYVA